MNLIIAGLESSHVRLRTGGQCHIRFEVELLLPTYLPLFDHRVFLFIIN